MATAITITIAIASYAIAIAISIAISPPPNFVWHIQPHGGKDETSVHSARAQGLHSINAGTDKVASSRKRKAKKEEEAAKVNFRVQAALCLPAFWSFPLLLRERAIVEGRRRGVAVL